MKELKFIGEVIGVIFLAFLIFGLGYLVASHDRVDRIYDLKKPKILYRDTCFYQFLATDSCDYSKGIEFKNDPTQDKTVKYKPKIFKGTDNDSCICVDGLWLNHWEGAKIENSLPEGIIPDSKTREEAIYKFNHPEGYNERFWNKWLIDHPNLSSDQILDSMLLYGPIVDTCFRFKNK